MSSEAHKDTLVDVNKWKDEVVLAQIPRRPIELLRSQFTLPAVPSSDVPEGSLWTATLFEDPESGYERVAVGLAEKNGTKLVTSSTIDLDVSRGGGHALFSAVSVGSSIVTVCSTGTDKSVFWSNGTNIKRIATCPQDEVVAGLAAVAPAKIASANFGFVIVVFQSGVCQLLQLRHEHDGDGSTTCGSAVVSGTIAGFLTSLGAEHPPMNVVLRQTLSGLTCQGFVAYFLLANGIVIRATIPTNFKVLHVPTLMWDPKAQPAEKAVTIQPANSKKLLVYENMKNGAVSVLLCTPGNVVVISDTPKALVKLPSGSSGNESAATSRNVSRAASPAATAASPARQKEEDVSVCSIQTRPNPAKGLLPSLKARSMFRNYPAFKAASKDIVETVVEHGTLQPEDDTSCPSPSSPQPNDVSMVPQPQPQPRSSSSQPHQKRVSGVPSSHHRPLLDDDHTLDPGPTKEDMRNTSMLYHHTIIKLPPLMAKPQVSYGKRQVASVALVHSALWLVVSTTVASSRSAELPAGTKVASFFVVDLGSRSVVSNTPLPVDVTGSSSYTIARLANNTHNVLWSVNSKGSDVNIFLRESEQDPPSALSPTATTPRRSHVFGSSFASDGSPRSLSSTMGPTATSPLMSLVTGSSPRQSSTTASEYSVTTSSSGVARSHANANKVEELSSKLALLIADINQTPVPARDPAMVRKAEQSEQLSAKVRQLQNRAATSLWAPANQQTIRRHRFHLWRRFVQVKRALHKNYQRQFQTQRLTLVSNSNMRREVYRQWKKFLQQRVAQRNALQQCELLFSAERSVFLKDSQRRCYTKWTAFRCQAKQRRAVEVLLGSTASGTQRYMLRCWKQFVVHKKNTKSKSNVALLLAQSFSLQGSRVIRREAWAKWVKFAGRRRTDAQKERLVGIFRANFETTSRRHAFEKWGMLVEKRRNLRSLESVATVFGTRSLNMRRAYLFHGWKNYVRNVQQKRAMLARCRNILQSSIAQELRRCSFEQWSHFVAERRDAKQEEQQKLQQGVHLFLASTSLGLQQLYFQRWREFARKTSEDRAKEEGKSENIAKNFLRFSSSTALQTVYWRKWTTLCNMRREQAAKMDLLGRFLRSSTEGLLAIYGNKWKRFVALKTQERHKKKMAGLVGRTTTTALSKIYFNKWTSFVARAQHRRSIIQTVEQSEQRKYDGLLSRYLGKWLVHVFSMCKHRSAHQLQQLNTTAKESRQLEEALAEQLALRDSLVSKAIHVEDNNATLRHMISKTQAHHDALAADLDLAHRHIERINSATVRQKNEKRHLSKAVHLRKYFHKRSFDHEEYWSSMQRHLQDAEDLLRDMPEEAAPSCRLGVVSPAKSGKRLDDILQAANDANNNYGISPSRERTPISSYQPASNRASSPVRVPGEEKVDMQRGASQSGAAPVRLERSNRRAWMLNTLSSFEELVASARQQLKRDLMEEVKDDEKHMWNVESIVLGTGNPARDVRGISPQ